ncbi:MAG: hypothetical protein IPL05_09670 [Betaproteobacteria bacterium]|nr:hypothetical protein [Betaproteobacteria bacterium]
MKLIDKNDPDCVRRTRTIKKGFSLAKFKGAKTKLVNVYEIWSPVIAISNIVKLDCPFANIKSDF